ncbi:MAG: hypothetical protein KatS3mg105_2147 [Gemmatales bacterium]|nr:MAG: hypothetical protein KatS3mg105_2147 [Gemmatales bacterium]
MIAVAPGSTLDHVVFFSDDGVAYTMRINEVPASSGYGEPLAKHFRLGDQVRVINAITTDERFLPASRENGNGEPVPPYLLVVTARGQVLRIPFAPFRTASTKVGRRYCRLRDADRVVLAQVVRDETSIFLATASGRIIHFPIDEINILAGVGKGVMGIKLKPGDTCLGGALISSRNDRLVVETATGKVQEYRRDKYELTSRGGKGFPAVKRTSFIRVVPPPIELVDWDAVEGKKKAENNGSDRTLFD